jgi:hypothetical protein
MKNGSDFDNLHELAIEPGIETAAVKQRREKLEQQFIRVPVGWADKLAKTKRRSTLLVALHLLRLSWKKNSNTVSLTNSGLKEWGVSRQEKWFALNELKSEKLVTIESDKGKSPRITLLSNPTQNLS